MSSPLRLLVLGDAGGKVREFRVSRSALLVALVAPWLLLGILTGAVVLWALTSPSTQKVVSEHAPMGVSLAQHVELKAAAPKLLTAAAKESVCGPGMLLIQGGFCPKVKQKCLRYADPEGSMLRALRCLEYESPAQCQSEQRQTLRYCIDRDEFAEGSTERASNQTTLAAAQSACQRSGKRLCTSDEWTFACEGEQMRPYPYGFSRDASRCNIDRTDLVNAAGSLKDLRLAPDDSTKCSSPFGARNMSGNVEEFVLDRNGVAERRGGYWQPGANHCRASQPHQDPNYSGVETGFRCCADAPAQHP